MEVVQMSKKSKKVAGKCLSIYMRTDYIVNQELFGLMLWEYAYNMLLIE